MNIVYASARELAAAITSEKITSLEVVEAHLAQIEKHNPALNAVVTLDAERALRRAREADAALARGQKRGPLHGVPFTLKDCHTTSGMRTTAGFPPLTQNVPTEDGTVAARLEGAGGILLGKTNVPPMMVGPQTDNPIFGRTNNPWSLDRTPGGSSGGAAAAVAASMTPFDIGSDLGGSVRVPAHFCGLFGLKPTERRVSHAGHIPGLPGETRSVRIMASIGPLARDIGDLTLLYRIIAGPDGRDTEVAPVPIEPVDHLELADMRIAVAETFPGFPVSAETRQAIRDLASTVQPYCRAVHEAPLPELDYDWNRLFEPARLAIDSLRQGPDDAPIPLKSYLEALAGRDHFIRAWERFFEAWDALICPASLSTAFAHCEPGTPHRLDGREVDYWATLAHCMVFTYTGHPVVVLPYTLDTQGLPLGFQLVGRRWGESKLLAIAEALARITGPFLRPPGI